MALFKKKGQGVQRKVNLKFTIDCTRVVEDKVIVMRDFEKYLRENIKVNGKRGNLGNDVNVTSNARAILVQSDIPFSKRALKYLTKKYLRKVKISEYLRVIAVNKQNYEIRYLKIFNEEEEE